MNQIRDANLTDLFKTFGETISKKLNCHRVGTIVSFDSTDQTATVAFVDKLILLNPVESKEIEMERTLLLKCPVVIPYGKNGGFTMPIEVGDECLICFNDSNIDNWFISGTVSKPKNKNSHNINDAIIIPFIHSRAMAIQGYNNNATVQKHKDGGEISVNRKVTIKNSTEELGLILKDLVMAIDGILINTMAGPTPIDPVTKSTLLTITTQLNNLFN